MLDYVQCSALSVFLYMTTLFILAVLKKDNSIVDVGWGPGFILVALLTFSLGAGTTLRHVIVSFLVVVWGLRLAVHIYLRNRGKGEDFRYAAWRREWGKWVAPRSFFQIFLFQGFLLLVISYPVLIINYSQKPGIRTLDVVGLMVWCVGFLFEAVGDY